MSTNLRSRHAVVAAVESGRPPTGPAESAGINVLVLEDSRLPNRYADDIEALARHAVEPNPFYEPWMLLPALKTVATGKRLALVFVYSTNSSPVGPLLGFFPLERHSGYKGMPVRSMRMLAHPHCFLQTPIVHKAAVHQCIAEFLRWFAGTGVSLLELGCLPSDGPVRRSLTQLARWRRLEACSYDPFQRALFRPGPSADRYLRSALSGRRRKEYRRQLARLGELGRVEFRSATQGPERAWIQSFLELEQRGWKGRNGSAFASSAAGRRFFETAMRAAASRHRLDGLGLYLNDQAIALSCKLRSGDAAFAFKIAFDERYGGFSPGALIELAHIEWMHEQTDIRWMDSCATAEHFMANRLWVERRRIETLVVTCHLIGALAQRILQISSGLAQLRRRVARRLLSRELRERIRRCLS